MLMKRIEVLLHELRRRAIGGGLILAFSRLTHCLPVVFRTINFSADFHCDTVAVHTWTDDWGEP